VGEAMIVSDWHVTKPESVGLRNEPFDALVKWLDRDHQANIHGIVVVRHGKLLFEHYGTGEDECWGEPLGNVIHEPDSKHDLRSVTKSVTSLLLGIALERKLIGSIDDPVLGWFGSDERRLTHAVD
jgi:CubicO group peptidase (beta-lactamase class C family)